MLPPESNTVPSETVVVVPAPVVASQLPPEVDSPSSFSTVNPSVLVPVSAPTSKKRLLEYAGAAVLVVVLIIILVHL